MDTFLTGRCEACRSTCERAAVEVKEESRITSRPPQWPYKFLALTRPDSPLRHAIAECNDQFFPGRKLIVNTAIVEQRKRLSDDGIL